MYDRKLAIPQGLARIEILANKDEIDDFLKRGFSYVRIFRELSYQHKITMKYITFVYQIKKIYPELKKQKKSKNKKVKIRKEQSTSTNEQVKNQSVKQREKKQTNFQNPPVSFTEGASISDLIGDIEKKESK